MLEILAPARDLAGECEAILRALPGWFGIEESNLHYIDYVSTNPTFIARLDGKAVGFLALKQHFPLSAEIYVMAVHPDYHRQGVGRALVEAAEGHLKDTGTIFLQVKTLGASHPDEGYQKTRKFYLAMGFIPLEEFKDLWGDNPALQLVKYLG